MTTKHITPDRICKTALAIIKESGLEKLSMRRIAEKLKIQAPSLYQHVRNKAHLIELVQAYSFKAHHLVGNLNPACKDWQEYLFQILQNMRRFFIDNPSLFELFASYSPNSPEARQTFESFLQTMIDCGFTLHQVSYIGRSIRVYVLGHVQFEVSSQKFNHGQYPKVDSQFALNYQFFMVDGGYNHQASFDFGARLLIAGCEKLFAENHESQI